MTGAELAAIVRRKTYTDTTSFTNADIVASLNEIMDEIAPKITQAFQDMFLLPQTDDLVADQREYALPDGFIKLKQLEAKLDGLDWIKVDPFDLNNDRRPTAEADILENFGTGQGEVKYDTFRGSFKIYSGAAITSVTGGLKGWFIVYPPKFSVDGASSTFNITGTTDLSIAPSDTTVGIPRLFHKLIAQKVIVDWKLTQDKPVALNQDEQLWEVKFKEMVNVLRDQNPDEMVGLVGEDAHSVPNRETGANY